MSSYEYKEGDKIGVPGFVRGLHDMHAKEGKMDEKKDFRLRYSAC